MKNKRCRGDHHSTYEWNTNLALFKALMELVVSKLYLFGCCSIVLLTVCRNTTQISSITQHNKPTFPLPKF